MAGRTPPTPIQPFSLDFTPLRKLRKGEEITRQQLARAAGVNPVTIWRLEENRQKNPSLKHLLAIARALGVPIHQLYTVTVAER